MAYYIEYMAPECITIELTLCTLLCTSVEIGLCDPEIGYGDPSIE